jgi:hypothetical protein
MTNKKKKNPPLIRRCGAVSVHHRLLEEYPAFRQNQLNIESTISRRMALGMVARQGKPTVIPIVVHVVYKQPGENISAAQIKSQIAVLNKDYNSANADKKNTPDVWKSLVTAAGVKFQLASKDPSGNPTNGVTRTKTNEDSFSTDDSVKAAATGGADAWDTSKYINIWVCSLGNSLLGYAQFPGGPPATDGVVILNTAFGTKGTAAAPFNKGRTTTHELGHYFNLHHIWGDTQHCEGSDLVDDTPNQQQPNFGKPKFPHITCKNGPNGDMFMNYMDYVDDDTMVMFTSGQVTRMNATLDDTRKTLGT